MWWYVQRSFAYHTPGLADEKVDEIYFRPPMNGIWLWIRLRRDPSCRQFQKRRATVLAYDGRHVRVRIDHDVEHPIRVLKRSRCRFVRNWRETVEL